MLKGLKLVTLCCLALFGANSIAQADLIKLNKNFYSALNEGDSLGLSKYFHEDGMVTHVGKDTTFGYDLGGFLEVCNSFKSGMFNEKVKSIIALEVTPQIYTVQVEFQFYVNGKYSHCGIDHFTWIEKEGKLLIKDILSTDNVICGDDVVEEVVESEKEFRELDRLMNNWHKDVIALELESFFGLMTKDFFYLGTDPGERWSKKEFRKFCEPYFLEKKQTWSFVPIKRNWGMSENGDYAWFDESLDTWMDECRGSGVFRKEDGEWKIVQYNLTVLIENEKIEKFIKLRKK
jgi:hypothetical protein